MRRPSLTTQRIEALRVLADRARAAASARRDDLLLSVPRGERAELRRAIRFVDELAKWDKSRTKTAAGAK